MHAKSDPYVTFYVLHRGRVDLNYGHVSTCLAERTDRGASGWAAKRMGGQTDGRAEGRANGWVASVINMYSNEEIYWIFARSVLVMTVGMSKMRDSGWKLFGVYG